MPQLRCRYGAFQELELGEVIYCDSCGYEFEVVSLNPVELATLDEEEE